MFYQKKSIEKHLTCKVCDKLLTDPRNLPCGHTFCHICIESSAKENQNVVVCSQCDTKYEVPLNGFPTNHIAASLLEEQVNQVTQSLDVWYLREKLDSIDARCKKLHKSLSCGSEEMKEYCMTLRQQIDLATETRIEEIRQTGVEFKKQVDDYEKECSLSCESISDLAEEFDPFLSDINKLHSKVSDYLDQIDIYHDEVVAHKKKLSEKLSELETKERLLERKIFNNKIMIFEPETSELDPSCVGLVKFKSLVLKPRSFKNLNVSFVANHKILARAAYIASNQLIYVAYEVGQQVELACYSIDGSKVGNSRFIQLRNHNGNDVSLSFQSFWSFGNECCLVMRNNSPTYSSHSSSLYYSGSAYSLSANTPTIFIKINQDRNFIAIRGISFSSELEAANSSSIFLFDRKSRLVFIYNLNQSLDYKECFKLDIPGELRAMQANDDNLFLLNETRNQLRLCVFDFKKKLVINDVSLPSIGYNQLKMISRDYLIAYNDTTHDFWILDQKNLTHVTDSLELHGTDMHGNLQLSTDNSSYFVFYNEHQIWNIFKMDIS